MYLPSRLNRPSRANRSVRSRSIFRSRKELGLWQRVRGWLFLSLVGLMCGFGSLAAILEVSPEARAAYVAFHTEMGGGPWAQAREHYISAQIIAREHCHVRRPLPTDTTIEALGLETELLLVHGDYVREASDYVRALEQARARGLSRPPTLPRRLPSFDEMRYNVCRSY